MLGSRWIAVLVGESRMLSVIDVMGLRWMLRVSVASNSCYGERSFAVNYRTLELLKTLMDYLGPLVNRRCRREG